MARQHDQRRARRARPEAGLSNVATVAPGLERAAGFSPSRRVRADGRQVSPEGIFAETMDWRFAAARSRWRDLNGPPRVQDGDYWAGLWQWWSADERWRDGVAESVDQYAGDLLGCYLGALGASVPGNDPEEALAAAHRRNIDRIKACGERPQMETFVARERDPSHGREPRVPRTVLQ